MRGSGFESTWDLSHAHSLYIRALGSLKAGETHIGKKSDAHGVPRLGPPEMVITPLLPMWSIDHPSGYPGTKGTRITGEEQKEKKTKNL